MYGILPSNCCCIFFGFVNNTTLPLGLIQTSSPSYEELNEKHHFDAGLREALVGSDLVRVYVQNGA